MKLVSPVKNLGVHDMDTEIFNWTNGPCPVSLSVTWVPLYFTVPQPLVESEHLSSACHKTAIFGYKCTCTAMQCPVYLTK